MKKYPAILFIIGFLFTSGFSQAFRLAKPTLDSDNTFLGLASNSVTEIVSQGNSLMWFATGGGLSMSPDFGQTFVSFYPGLNNLPRGGISAIAVKGDTIWVAAVFDSLIQSYGYQQTGGGLAFSIDKGKNCTFVPQPIDDPADNSAEWNNQSVSFLPVTTPINNTTWDIAITDDYVYIVSWAGGIRRSADMGQTWQRIPLPSDDLNNLDCDDLIDFEINPRDPPDGNHNHKGFSILAYGDTIWIGTADGINLGIVESPECISWRKFNAQNSAISGNFVVAIDRQLWKGKETIWAATLTVGESGEYRAVSKTSDGGLTWTTTLVNERPYNFAFQDSIVYVCTERGLFKSIDGENWAIYTPIADIASGEQILTQYFYAAEVDRREGPTYLWVGTGDGVAKTASDGLTWTVYHSAVSTKSTGQPAIYAYPNPFAPRYQNVIGDDGHVRIQYNIDQPASVRLEIYNFAMEQVYRSDWKMVMDAGDHHLIWNGRATNGEIVANGTYFCKLIQKSNGNEVEHWTKLIVIN